MDFGLEQKALKLMKKTRRFLLALRGRDFDEASDREIFHALSNAFSEEVMGMWKVSYQSAKSVEARRLYYISMEYLPGKIFGQVVFALQAEKLVLRVLEMLKKDPAVFFSCDVDPGLGNGGLGRLASCFLDSLSALDYPCTAYGIRYQYGIFKQELENGVQKERADPWLRYENPWEWRRDDNGQEIFFEGKCQEYALSNGEPCYQGIQRQSVRVIPYDTPIVSYKRHYGQVGTLRLWSTKVSPKNFNIESYNVGELAKAAENTSLTDVLYPNDMNDFGRKSRLKQEYLLVSASIKDIIRRQLLYYGNFEKFCDLVRIQINDTHPSLVVAELTHTLVTKASLTWEQALEWTTEVLGFTNHTILTEAIEQFDESLFRQILPCQFSIIGKLNQIFRNQCGDRIDFSKVSLLEQGKVKMGHLAILGSHKVNGVSQLHADLLKQKVFADFAHLYPDRFLGITNGISHRRFLKQMNPTLSDLISKLIQDTWIYEPQRLQELKAFSEDTQVLETLGSIKKENKQKFSTYLQHAPSYCLLSALNTDSIFDVQIKRIHEYKRQLMLACHLIMLYQELLEGSSRIARTVIVGGKAASGYFIAKKILEFLFCIARTINQDSRCKGQLQVILLENYNVSLADEIIPAIDLSEQISLAGMEASGTGNMKMSLNGALTIGTEDGANIEMHEQIGSEDWPFSFGADCQTITELKHSNAYHPETVIAQNPKIQKMLQAIEENRFAKSEEEKQVMQVIFRYLTQGHEGVCADPYFILYDLPSYFETQLKVEQLYQDPLAWQKKALMQIAGMGYFSSDRSIQEYNEKIWGLTPVAADPVILEDVQKQFVEAGIERLFF